MEADGNSMPCDYCKEYGHLESECRLKKTERRLDLAIGCFFGIFLIPWFLLGAVAGATWSALRKGFLFAGGFWDRWVEMVRGPKGGGS